MSTGFSVSEQPTARSRQAFSVLYSPVAPLPSANSTAALT
jgi:hypothetical protein